MKINLYGILIGFTVLTIGLTGCSFGNHLSGNSQSGSGSNNSSTSIGSSSDSSDDSEVILTQRQMDILEKMGLSTNYDELTYSQQQSIVEIENMLSYVEDKYEISFSYLGYYPSEMGIAASMKAYPTSGSKNLDMFTITKTDDGYEDDYINVMSEDLFLTHIKNIISEMYPDRTIVVYGTISKTLLTEVATDETNFDGMVWSGLSIFVDENEFTENEFNDLKDKLTDYLTEHQLPSSVDLVLLKTGYISDVSKYDYEDYQVEKYYADKFSFYVK